MPLWRLEMLSAIRRLFGRGEDDHAKVMRLSSEYLDGELEAGPAEMVERHAGVCPPCRAFLNTLRATVSMLGSMTQAEAPQAFRERLREAVRSERAG